jgi:myo-inositol catabolism protein IolC
MAKHSLTTAQWERVLEVYQACRAHGHEYAQAVIETHKALGYAEADVRAVIEDFEYINEGSAA